MKGFLTMKLIRKTFYEGNFCKSCNIHISSWHYRNNSGICPKCGYSSGTNMCDVHKQKMVRRVYEVPKKFLGITYRIDRITKFEPAEELGFDDHMAMIGETEHEFF